MTGQQTYEVDGYQRLLDLLAEHNAEFRLIDHPPEGQTDLASELRGHPLGQAAKCLIMRVKLERKARRYVLGVVPGDRTVDFAAVKGLYGGRSVGLADNDTAERLAGSVSGTILPFAGNEELDLVVDPALFDNEEIFFNAARLDRSVALATDEYRRIACPRVHPIAGTPAPPPPPQQPRQHRWSTWSRTPR